MALDLLTGKFLFYIIDHGHSFISAIKNPELIKDQITKLKENTNNNFSKDIETIDKELRKVENEETRILNAYRENVITLDQLKEQMSIIREKKEQLHKERQAKEKCSLSEKNIEDYCLEIESLLDDLDFETNL